MRVQCQPILVVGMLGILLVAGCHDTPKPAESPAAPGASAEAAPNLVTLSAAAQQQGGIKTDNASYRNVSETFRVPGNLQPRSDAIVIVSARAAGMVERLSAQVGDAVHTGQTLATLTSLELAQAQAQYRESVASEQQAQAALERQRSLAGLGRAQAQVKVEAARRQLARYESLFHNGIVSRQDYEAAQATVRQTELALNEAEVTRRDTQSGVLVAELARARQAKVSLAERIRLLGGDIGGQDGRIPVRSTIAGRVASREVALGQAVDVQAPLFKIVDVRKLDAVLDVPEGQVQSVRVGQPIAFEADALPGHRFAAKVAGTGDVVDPASRKITVRCVVDNPAGLLKPGMFVTASLPVASAQRLTVADGAIQTMDGQPVVFVAQGEGRFERRSVVLGPRAEGRTAIASGLKPGEPVVVAGAFWLKSEFQKSQLED